MSGLERVGQFGEYEVWRMEERDGPSWSITDAAGEIIEPGDDDLLEALQLVADLRRREP